VNWWELWPAAVLILGPPAVGWLGGLMAAWAAEHREAIRGDRIRR